MRRKQGRAYRIPWRRRREGKTDYYARYRMLISGKTRAVIRKSLRHLIVQFVDADIKGDKTLSFTTSMELRKYGWKYNCGNIPAAYLTGFLAGLKAKRSDINEAILDIGPQRSTDGCRLYAALKGLIDSGIEIPHDEEVFPSNERILGKHIEKYATLLKKQNAESYKKQFGRHLTNKIPPEEISKNFLETIKNIAKEFNTEIPSWMEESE